MLKIDDLPKNCSTHSTPVGIFLVRSRTMPGHHLAIPAHVSMAALIRATHFSRVMIRFDGTKWVLSSPLEPIPPEFRLIAECEFIPQQ